MKPERVAESTTSASIFIIQHAQGVEHGRGRAGRIISGAVVEKDVVASVVVMMVPFQFPFPE